MKLKIIFMVQGAILIVFGLWGLLDGESALSGWGWEATPELLTFNRGFSISQLVLGVIAFRIPAWAGDNLREPAFIGGAINTAFLINIWYDLSADAISGIGVTINLVLCIIFAILFFVMGAKHKND